jgi:hypothetical protein
MQSLDLAAEFLSEKTQERISITLSFGSGWPIASEEQSEIRVHQGRIEGRRARLPQTVRG